MYFIIFEKRRPELLRYGQPAHLYYSQWNELIKYANPFPGILQAVKPFSFFHWRSNNEEKFSCIATPAAAG